MDIDKFLDEYNIEQESLAQQEKLNKAKLSEDFISSKDTSDRVIDYATNIATKAIEGIDLLGEAGLTAAGLEDEETFAQSVEAYRNVDKMTHGIDATTGEAEESITSDLLSGAVPLIGGAKLTSMAAKGTLGKAAQDIATRQLARDAEKSALRVIAETEGAYGAIGALQGAQTSRIDPLTGEPIVDSENLGHSLAEGFAFNAALGAATRAGEISRAITQDLETANFRGKDYTEEKSKNKDIDFWIDDENNFEFSKVNPDNEIKDEVKNKYRVNVRDVKEDKEFAADSTGRIYVDEKLKKEKDKNPTAKEVYKILIDHEAGHIDRFEKEKANVDIATEEALRHLDTLAQLTELYTRAKDKNLVRKYYKKALDAFELYTYNIKDKKTREAFYNTFDAVSEIAKDKTLPKELKEQFITDVIKEKLGYVSYKGNNDINKLHAFTNKGEAPEWFNNETAEKIKEQVGQAAVERQLKENSKQSEEYGLDYSSYNIGSNFNINAKIVADFIEKAYKFNIKRIEEEYNPKDKIVQWLKSKEGKQFIIESVIDNLKNYIRSGKNKHFFIMRDGKTVFVKGVNINKLYDEMLKQAKKYSKEDRILDTLEKTQGDKVRKSYHLRDKIIEDYRRYLQDRIYTYMEAAKVSIDDVNKDETLKSLVEDYEAFYNKLLTTKRKKELLRYMDTYFAKNYEKIKHTIPSREELARKKERIKRGEHLKGVTKKRVKKIPEAEGIREINEEEFKKQQEKDIKQVDALYKADKEFEEIEKKAREEADKIAEEKARRMREERGTDTLEIKKAKEEKKEKKQEKAEQRKDEEYPFELVIEKEEKSKKTETKDNVGREAKKEESVQKRENKNENKINNQTKEQEYPFELVIEKAPKDETKKERVKQTETKTESKEEVKKQTTVKEKKVKKEIEEKIARNKTFRKRLIKDYIDYLRGTIENYIKDFGLEKADNVLKSLKRELKDIESLYKNGKYKLAIKKIDVDFINNYETYREAISKKKGKTDFKPIQKARRALKIAKRKAKIQEKIRAIKKAKLVDTLDIKFAKTMVKARAIKLKEKELFRLLYVKASEKNGLIEETPFNDIKLLPEKIEINKQEEVRIDDAEPKTSEEATQEEIKQEATQEAYSNKFIDEEEGRFELRYVRGIDKLYAKLYKLFGSKKNKYEIEEGMPYISEVVDKIKDGAKVRGIALKFKNKAYAFANTRALQAKAAIHEFLHLVYRDKSETEIRKITDNVFNYLITHKEFRDRINYTGEVPKYTIIEKEAMQYILGNKDMRQILFGIQRITDAMDDANAVTSNILNRVFKLVGGEALVNKFKQVEKVLPKSIFDLVQEVKGVDGKDTIRILTDYKKAKKALYDKLTETIDKNIDDALKNDLSEKELKIMFQSGLFRDVDPEKLVAKYGEDLTDAWRALRKKFHKKIEFIEDSSRVDALKPKKIRTYEELKKIFGDDWEEALDLIVMNTLKRNKHFYLLSNKEKLEAARPIFELFDDIKTDLDDHSRVIGYTPYILETSYDLRVAFSEDMRYKLEEQGYKSEDGYLYYKRTAEANIASEVMHPVDFNKRAGFNIIVETKDEIKKIKEFFGHRDLRIRKIEDVTGIDKNGNKITKVKYEITYQPKIKDIKNITSIKDDAKSLILKTYQKMLKEQFNKFDLPERILNKKEVLFDEENGIFSNEKKDGYIKFTKEEADFLNRNLSDKTGIRFDKIYVRQDIKDLILAKEILPENETMKKLIKLQKGLIARLKWNLTGVSVSAYNNAIMSGLLATGYFGVNPKHILRVLKDTKRDYEVFKKLKEKFIKDKNVDKKDIESFFRKYYDKNLFVEIMLDGKMASLFDDVDVLIGKSSNYADYVLYEELKKLEKKYGLFNTEKMYKLLKDVTLDRDSKFGKVLSAFYSDIDLFSRAISYRFLKERFGKEKAIKMVNDMFIDYSISSRQTTSTLDLTVAPFLAWTLRMQGGIFRLAKEKPLNFAGMIALYMGINAMLDDEKYYDLNDEFAGDLRIDSWFIHKAFMDDMILHTNLIAQTYEGKIGKMLALEVVPKTYEEAYAVWKGHRDKMELLGFNFSYGLNKKEILERKNKKNYELDKGINFR